MKNASLLRGILLALACAGVAQSSSGGTLTKRTDWQSQAIGAPPSQPLASPGLYQSGNECGTDRAEAEWDRNYKFLGYACVRPNTR